MSFTEYKCIYNSGIVEIMMGSDTKEGNNKCRAPDVADNLLYNQKSMKVKKIKGKRLLLFRFSLHRPSLQLLSEFCILRLENLVLHLNIAILSPSLSHCHRLLVYIPQDE